MRNALIAIALFAAAAAVAAPPFSAVAVAQPAN